MQLVISGGSFVAQFSTAILLPFVRFSDLTIVTTVVCAILIIGVICLDSVASTCGNLWSVVWAVFRNEWTLHFCTPMPGMFSSIAIDIAYRTDGARVGADV